MHFWDRSVRTKSRLWLDQFAIASSGDDIPSSRARRLEGDDVLAQLHDKAAKSPLNATSTPTDANVGTHFAAFVHVQGRLYELDGRRKEGPLDHGATTASSLLRDACRVIQQEILERADPSETRFAITALTKKQESPSETAL